MLSPKITKGYLDNKLLKEIISEYKESLSSDFSIIQLSIFVGFIEIEEWLEYYYDNLIKSGNCYEIEIEGIKVVILRTAVYEEDKISIFPFYKKNN